MEDVTVFDLTAPPTGALHLTGEGLNLSSDQGVRFARNSSVLQSPLGADSMWQQLINHLGRHPDHALHLTGYFDGSERNTTLFKDLGLARAEVVKRQLVKAGASDVQIGTAGRSSIDLNFVGDTLLNGLTARVSDERPVEKETFDVAALQAAEKRLRAHPQTLYFDMGATAIPVSDSLERYLKDAQNYLFAYPDRAIVLTGHTDGVGSAEKNLGYGQERADFTKRVLSERGISARQIKTRSAGETQPIADNDTREGRSKNRRVEINIE